LLIMTPGTEPSSRISNSFRRRLEEQGKQAQGVAANRYMSRARGRDHAAARLVFRVKPERMAAQKLPNVFADPRHRGFSSGAPARARSRAAAGHRHSCARMRTREIIAFFAGVADGHRFSMMFQTPRDSAVIVGADPRFERADPIA